MISPRVIAFVLAGGEGRRLRPFTEECPKPALPFAGGFRIIDFVLSNLWNSGVRSVYVPLQYRPQILLEHLERIG
jgi:glucose-1-phosphate adenylyltransferase